MNPDTNRYVRLNDTGSRRWESLEGELDSQELVDALVETWRVPSERASADVIAFLTALADRGLVELAQP